MDGIVVTHGTDTIEETAYFLDLTVATDKPVALVGAMRPATAKGADGPLNLLNAVKIAAAPESRGRGVLVTLNEEIHSAREVTKTNTTEVGAFKSPNAGPVGLLTAGHLRYYDVLGGERLHFELGDRADLPRVEIVYAHANMDAGLVDASAQAGAKGLVLAGVGNGNMSQSAQEAFAALAKQGTVVVRSSRVGSGWVSRNVRSMTTPSVLSPRRTSTRKRRASSCSSRSPRRAIRPTYRRCSIGQAAERRLSLWQHRCRCSPFIRTAGATHEIGRQGEPKILWGV